MNEPLRPDPERPADEAGVREAIAAFEQILEALPNDRLALETLWEAYEQIGERARALDYLVRLARAIADEGDAEAAPRILEKLNAISPATKEIQAVRARLAELAAPRPAEPSAAAPSRRKAADLSAELTLAWNLAQAGVISQEEYATIARDLSDSALQATETPVTAQHVIFDRALPQIENILQFLSTDGGLPLIPLGQFDVLKEAYDRLPLDFMKRRAAIVFEVLDSDVLVAVLNPYDTELRDEVRRLTGRPCHFFLATAPDYDAQLAKILESQKGLPGTAP